MESGVLLKMRSLELLHEARLTQDIEDAVRETIIGNPSGIQYQHLDSAKKIHEMDTIRFFTLRRGGVLIYVMALVERITQFKKSTYNTYNVRYVSFSEKLAKKTTADRKYQSQRRIGNSFFKEGMQKHSETIPFSLKGRSTHPDKKLYYAYVEDSNIRSMEFTQFFFEKISELSVIPASKLFPRRNDNLSKINDSEIDKMLDLLKKEYSQHSFYFCDKENLADNYYILKDGEEIVMGACVHQVNWKIVNLPSILGRLFIKTIPIIPLFSRLLKKDKFRFLSFDTFYCQPEKESQLPTFIEAIMAETRIYSAMLYFNKKEPQFNRLRPYIKRGLLGRIFKGASGAVLARFVNFSEKEKEEFKEHPVYISAYDMT